jgi:hypothetical protein
LLKENAIELRVMTSKESRIEHCRVLTTTTREIYRSIKSVFCPILGIDVVFNSIGFRHLLYKADGTTRHVSEQIYKLTLFPLAIPVIKNAVGVSEERDVEIRVSGRKKTKKYKKGKSYALVAEVGRKNPVSVRVVIFKIGTGNYVFYSIMKDTN